MNSALLAALLFAALLLAGGGRAVAASNGQHEFAGHGFAGKATNQAAAPDAATQAVTVARVVLVPSSVVGGASAKAKVYLTAAAPTGGALVRLTVSNRKEVSLASSVLIAAGRKGATVVLNTLPLSAGTSATVIILAKYNHSFAGAALSILAAATPDFSVSLQPSSVSVDHGSSAAVNLSTQVTAGFDQALSLNASQAPAGITVNFSPSLIAAPGAGTAVVTVAADSSVAAGTYAISLSASDGSATHAATLQVTVGGGSGGIVGPLHGCLHLEKGHAYQAVEFSMKQGGTVNFDAYLYYGATCDPNQQADRFGFGQPVSLGGFGYVFWFSDFADQLHTSAIWTVGDQTSQCVDYTTAPDC